MTTLARSVLLRMSKSRWLADRVMTRGFARRAVKRFMPGETLDDALNAAAALAPDRLGSIITKLGENLANPTEADAVRAHYLDVLDRIAARGLDAHISVKPTQLGLDFSFDHCAEHMEALARKAEATGSIFWIDMEDSSYVDRTLDLYRRLKAVQPKVGIALQAYLRRTPQDLKSLLLRLLRIGEPIARGRRRGPCAPDLRHPRPHPGGPDRGQGAIARRGRRRLRDPHALRHPDGRPAPPRGGRPQGEVPHQLRQRLVPLVHAPARRAAGQCLVHHEEHASRLSARRNPNHAIFRTALLPILELS